MKTKFNFISGTLAVLMMASPLATFAATSGSTTKTASTFCSKIDAGTAKLGTDFTKKIDAYVTKKDAGNKNLATKRAKWDENKLTGRTTAAAKRSTHYDALTGKANTDAKKAAVVTFKSAITTAVTKKQTAVDAAVQTFRTGVDALIAGKLSTISTNATTLKQSVTDAIATAKTSCANGTDSKAAKTSLETTIKADLASFKTDKSSLSIKTEVDALAVTRKQAIVAATAQFKTDVASARTDLKTAFAVK